MVLCQLLLVLKTFRTLFPVVHRFHLVEYRVSLLRKSYRFRSCKWAYACVAVWRFLYWYSNRRQSFGLLDSSPTDTDLLMTKHSLFCKTKILKIWGSSFANCKYACPVLRNRSWGRYGLLDTLVKIAVLSALLLRPYIGAVTINGLDWTA